MTIARQLAVAHADGAERREVGRVREGLAGQGLADRDRGGESDECGDDRQRDGFGVDGALDLRALVGAGADERHGSTGRRPLDGQLQRLQIVPVPQPEVAERVPDDGLLVAGGEGRGQVEHRGEVGEQGRELRRRRLDTDDGEAHAWAVGVVGLGPARTVTTGDPSGHVGEESGRDAGEPVGPVEAQVEPAAHPEAEALGEDEARRRLVNARGARPPSREHLPAFDRGPQPAIPRRHGEHVDRAESAGPRRCAP